MGNKIVLPKKEDEDKIHYYESEFQGRFTKWIKKNAWASWPYELKVAKGKKLEFSKFRPQQLPKLYQARTGAQHLKLSDLSIETKPYDGYVFYKSEAYVGIMYDCGINKKIFYLVDILDIIREKDSGAKYISEQFAGEKGLKFNF